MYAIGEGDGVTLGVLLILILGVTDGVTLGVKLGVLLIDILGVIDGVILILILGVTLGVGGAQTADVATIPDVVIWNT